MIDMNKYIDRFNIISKNVKCSHNSKQIEIFVNSFLSIPESIKGCIVEAGSFKGGSAAKFSIIAKMINRELVIFDSFEGLPEDEHSFKKGSYNGTLDEVKSNIEKYGEISSCRFIKGWFKDTMPNFSEKICGVFLDVDLSASTKTCLKYLYPLIIPGGVLYSHDGNFPLVAKVYNDNEFWEKEVGCQKPFIEVLEGKGLEKNKIIKIVKEKKYDFVAGIPCSKLKKFLEGIKDYIPCTREDEAMALAVGAYLAGKEPRVFLQNSGLGNIIDVITSLLKPYGIKIDLLISLRNKPEHHAFMGKITKELLKLLNYEKYRMIEWKE